MRESFSNHPHSPSNLPSNELTSNFEMLASETGDKALMSQEEASEPDLTPDKQLDSFPTTESVNTELSSKENEETMRQGDKETEELIVNISSDSAASSLETPESEDEITSKDSPLDIVFNPSLLGQTDNLIEDNADLSLEFEEEAFKPDVFPSTMPASTHNPTADNRGVSLESKDEEVELFDIEYKAEINQTMQDNSQLLLETDEQTVEPDSSSHITTVSTDNLAADNDKLSLESEQTEEEAEIEDLSPENGEQEVIVEEDVTPQTNWFELACKLRGQNQELIQTVVALEQALAQARQDIQEQKQSNAQFEQSLSLTSQVESSLIIREAECLKEENQGLKGQIAELERQCAVLKEENQEKSHQLATSEGHIRELHSRLQRQQRYTLQYKAALEQHLGESFDSPSDTAIDESSQDLGIQPWSKEQIAADNSNPDIPNQEESTPVPQETSVAADVPLPSPSFQVNLSKIANRYGSPEPSKSRSSHGIIDLPGFLRRRSR